MAYDRIGQKFRTGPWLGRTVLRPTIEGALLYFRLKYGVDLAKADPEVVVAHTRVPVLLIHGLADRNIRPQHSKELHDSNPAYVSLWEVRGAAHCGAVAAAPEEFDRRVLGWFDAHGEVLTSSSAFLRE